MQIKLKKSVTMAQQHARTVPAHAGYTTEQFKWRDLLGKIGGMTLEVETQHLFGDQFNTGPIPDISPTGIRVMNDMVVEIIDDVRPTAVKCDYCGLCVLDVAEPDCRCPKCLDAEQGRGGYRGVSYVNQGFLRRLDIKPVR